MTEITLREITKSYGANKVLNNVTFEVQSGERIGIVGRNGTGKTTIFKMIAGIESPDGGLLSIRKGATIGYLSQIPIFPDDWKVIDVLNNTFHDLFKIQDELKKVEEYMANSTIDQEKIHKIVQQYGNLQAEFEQRGGYEIEERINRVCDGLKINDDFRSRIFSALSGGEKTIVILGQVLLQAPDILLLDEPTNHLDLDSIEWLEKLLKEYKGTVQIISHDRYFLDKVVNRIVEIEDGESDIYHGNYSYFVEEKERRLLAEFEIYKNQQKMFTAMKEAIKELRDWGSRSQNEKFFRRAASLEKRLEKMEAIKKPSVRKNLPLEFSVSNRSGRDVLEISGLRKIFNGNILIDCLDFHTGYGEKIAVLGKNGSGKTTLIKLILGLFEPEEGEIKLGSNVKIGYIEQQISFSDLNSTVLQIFRDNFIGYEEKARSILAKFQFYGKDVFKRTGDLSGGEMVRLRLCQLMHQDINLLILDEPTNHLDIESREVLEEALQEFEGTIIFVSHDRYFVNKLASRIVEIREGSAYNYAGDYNYFVSKRLEEQEQKNNVVPPKKKKQAKNKVVKGLNTPNNPTESKNNIDETINDIESLESLIRQKDIEIEEFASDHEKLSTLYEERCRLQEQLDFLYEELVRLEN